MVHVRAEHHGAGSFVSRMFLCCVKAGQGLGRANRARRASKIATMRNTEDLLGQEPGCTWWKPDNLRFGRIRQAACALPIARTSPDVEIEPLR